MPSHTLEELLLAQAMREGRIGDQRLVRPRRRTTGEEAMHAVDLLGQNVRRFAGNVRSGAQNLLNDAPALMDRAAVAVQSLPEQAIAKSLMSQADNLVEASLRHELAPTPGTFQDKLAGIIEKARSGELTAEQQSAFDELVRRGAINLESMTADPRGVGGRAVDAVRSGADFLLRQGSNIAGRAGEVYREEVDPRISVLRQSLQDIREDGTIRVPQPNGQQLVIKVPQDITAERLRDELDALGVKAVGAFQDARDSLSRVELIPGTGLSISTLGADRSSENFPAFARAAAVEGADLFSGAANLATTAGLRLMTGQPLYETEALRARRERFGVPSLPPIGSRPLPIPGGEQIVTGAEAASDFAVDRLRRGDARFSDLYQDRLLSGRRLAADNPAATMLGTATGAGVGFQPILAGTKALAKGFARAAATRPMKAADDVAEQISKGNVAPNGAIAAAPATANEALQAFEAVSDPGFRRGVSESVRVMAEKFSPAFLRTAEAGYEGAMLGLLTEGDAADMAAFAAGAQAGSNIVLGTLEKVRARGLASVFAGLVIAHQFIRAVGPGERNLFLSSDDVTNEMLVAYGLGALSRVGGFDRIDKTGRIASAFGAPITDMVTRAQRGFVGSLVAQLAGNDENAIGPDALGRLVSRFDRFSNAQIKRLERAANSGKFAEEVDKMLREVPGFAEAMGYE